MIRAYNDTYLEEAMENLGTAMDTAVRAVGMTVDEFMESFISSGVARLYEQGWYEYTAGMSGMELLMKIMRDNQDNRPIKDIQRSFEKTPEYWTGWILAYWQWRSVMSYQDIMSYMKAKDVLRLYHPLHEASEERACDSFRNIMLANPHETKLATLRKSYDLSQRDLSIRSGVSLRMISQYEQREKNINRAAVSSLLSLSTIFSCRIEDLMEPIPLTDEY